jgi:pimeloyl-ACP methyl ester carboxylesterase
MDWIETEKALDPTRVAVVGHSRGGKTALWTGATDKRFALACSNDSGCSGAKLNHIDLPASEHIAQITKHFHYWFCTNYLSCVGRDDKLDFDQHELVALMAPRLVAIASATEDAWAGPCGEWWSARLASPAWEVYGLRGLVGDTWPKAECPQQGGSISYHMRTGPHALTPYDWKCYMDFADLNGWRR